MLPLYVVLCFSRTQRRCEDDVDYIYKKNWFYILPTNLAIRLSHFPLFVSIKTITKLNLGEGETFEIKNKIIAIVVHAL